MLEKRSSIPRHSDINTQEISHNNTNGKQDILMNKSTGGNSIKKYAMYWKRMQAYYAIQYKKILHCYNDFTDKDKLFHYASSLSFYNIFSIIPIFLTLFSIFTNFPSFQEQLQNIKQVILDSILPTNVQDVSKMLDGFLLNGKEMGFLGFLISLISSFIFFRNFDDICARIFSAKKRSFFDSFIVYWLLITLIPLFVVTSLYFNTFIAGKYSNILTHVYAALPLIITWSIFALLFRIAANKSLHSIVLLFSSFVGAVIWYLVKFLFFYYVFYNKFYSTIYGSVSIVMFVLLWIYVSWLIVLISMRMCKKLDDRFTYK